MTDNETLEEFKNSFSYGSRSDLAFKFLKALPEADAGEFLRQLLDRLGETIDDGDATRPVDLAYEWQVRAYPPKPDAARTWAYDDGPFTPLAKPLAESRLALLTSSGHFVDGDDPGPLGVKDMTQQEAMDRVQEFLREAPALSAIPVDTPPEELRVRHGGYDIRGSAADAGVSFPLTVLREMVADGTIAELAPDAYSFVGATAQRRLMKESLPEWTRLMRDAEVDVALLVPV